MDSRTYLWLFLTFDIISASPSKYSKISKIEALLADLPSQVSDAYEKILSRSSDKATARILLQIVVAARRPLTVEEVNIALTLATQPHSCESNEELIRNLWPYQKFKSIIKNLCGLFISVHDQKVSLLHQTAREFLILENQQYSPKQWKGSLDLVLANSIMAEACVSYLNFEEFSHQQPQRDYYYHLNVNEITVYERLYRFLNYAACSWSTHFNLCASKNGGTLIEPAQNLCNASLAYKSFWFDRYCCEIKLEEGTIDGSLCLASLLGLECVTKVFVDEGADINARYGIGNTALNAAVIGGHYRIAQILLENGADTNQKNEDGDSAFHLANRIGNPQLVHLLLQYGANVEAENWFSRTALQEAACRGDIEVLRMLLKYKADIDNYRSLWQCSTRSCK